MEKREKMIVEVGVDENKVPLQYVQYTKERMTSDLGKEYAKRYANEELSYEYEKIRLLGNGGDLVRIDKRDDTAMAKKYFKYVRTIIRITLE